MAAALPEDAQPSSLLAAALVASGTSAWEHSLWFFVSAWFVYSEPWASVEGVTSAFGAWCSVLGLAFRNDVSDMGDASSVYDAATDASTAAPASVHCSEHEQTNVSPTLALSEALPPLQSPSVRSASSSLLAPNTPFSNHIARTTLSFPKLHDGRTDDLLSLPRVPHTTTSRVALCDGKTQFESIPLASASSLRSLTSRAFAAAQPASGLLQKQPQPTMPQSLFSARGDRSSVGRAAILEDEDEADNHSSAVDTAATRLEAPMRDTAETVPVILAHDPSPARASLLLACWRHAAHAGRLLSFLRPGLAGYVCV